MKKIIVVLLFLVLGSLSFAGILDYSAELTCEFYPELSIDNTDSEELNLKNVFGFGASFDIILFKKLYIGGSSTTFMLYPMGDVDGKPPFIQHYTAHAFLNLDSGFTVGVEHKVESLRTGSLNNADINTVYTKVYIKLKVSSLEN